MRVTVYHNCATDEHGRHLGMLDGYEPGHPVTPVADLNIPGPADPFKVLDHVYFLFNVGDDSSFGTPYDVAVEYRKRRNRSLSMGDVARIDGDWYGLLEDGWAPIAEPKIEITTLHGTTPLEGIDL